MEQRGRKPRHGVVEGGVVVRGFLPKARGAPQVHGTDLRWAAISCFSAPTIKPLAFDFDPPHPLTPKQTPATNFTIIIHYCKAHNKGCQNFGMHMYTQRVP